MTAIESADVIVIGAGVSGLRAAQLLQAGGRRTVVLESRSRIGGRTFSPDLGGGPVDLGASWVWDHETHVHALIRELGLATYRPVTDGIDRYQRGGQVQSVRLPTSWSPEARIVGGTEAIARVLAERVGSVRLEARVTAIERHEGGLHVRTEGAEFVAEQVVAALPPSLMMRTVAMPPLDERIAGLLRQVPVWMGDIANVVAVYASPFWRSRGLSGRAASADGPMVEIHDLSGPDDRPPALFGFVPRSLAGGELEVRVRRQLAELFGEDAGQPSTLRILKWWEEPDTTPPDFPNQALQLLGQPALREPLLDGRLHLVSTETSGQAPGHIDGAVERAEAVAGAILSSG